MTRIYTKVVDLLKKSGMYWTVEDLEYIRDAHKDVWDEQAEANVVQTIIDRIKRAGGASINIYTGEIA